MQKLILYLEAIRFFKPQGTILLILPCFIALALLEGDYYIEASTYVIFAVGAFLVRSTACVINDLWDVKFDKAVKRTKNRPLASNRITRMEAVIVAISLLMLALLCLLELSGEAILAGLFAPLLVITYPLFKRFTYMPQIYLGVCMSYGVLMAGLEVEGAVSLNMALLFIGMVLWAFGYDTIYAYQDIEDDELIGVKSSALFLGNKGKKYLAAAYMIFLLMVLIVATRLGLGFGFFLLLNILGIYILSRIQFLNFSDIEECQIEFTHNIYYGAFILAAINIMG